MKVGGQHLSGAMTSGLQDKTAHHRDSRQWLGSCSPAVHALKFLQHCLFFRCDSQTGWPWMIQRCSCGCTLLRTLDCLFVQYCTQNVGCAA